jgi:hypothetical protein
MRARLRRGKSTTRDGFVLGLSRCSVALPGRLLESGSVKKNLNKERNARHGVAQRKGRGFSLLLNRWRNRGQAFGRQLIPSGRP